MKVSKNVFFNSIRIRFACFNYWTVFYHHFYRFPLCVEQENYKTMHCCFNHSCYRTQNSLSSYFEFLTIITPAWLCIFCSDIQSMVSLMIRSYTNPLISDVRRKWKHYFDFDFHTFQYTRLNNAILIEGEPVVKYKNGSLFPISFQISKCFRSF